MSFLLLIVTVLGLCIFETISSVDNAIINARVLSKMPARLRRFFLLWGLIFAVFVVRGVLPWFIVWITTPSLTFTQAFSATLSNDVVVRSAIERSSALLLSIGGTFLLLLFTHWLLREPKHYSFATEKKLFVQNRTYVLITCILLIGLGILASLFTKLALLGIVIGTALFFAAAFIKNEAQRLKEGLSGSKLSYWSLFVYLEVLDAAFSVDSVLGAFAFTLSVPLILIGNGLGALIVRQLTLRNVDTIKKYIYLQNGAMYSIGFLGLTMIIESMGFNVPEWIAPLITFSTLSFFFWRSTVYNARMRMKRTSFKG